MVLSPIYYKLIIKVLVQAIVAEGEGDVKPHLLASIPMVYSMR